MYASGDGEFSSPPQAPPPSLHVQQHHCLYDFLFTIGWQMLGAGCFNSNHCAKLHIQTNTHGRQTHAYKQASKHISKQAVLSSMSHASLLALLEPPLAISISRRVERPAEQVSRLRDYQHSHLTLLPPAVLSKPPYLIVPLSHTASFQARQIHAALFRNVGKKYMSNGAHPNGKPLQRSVTRRKQPGLFLSIFLVD